MYMCTIYNNTCIPMQSNYLKSLNNYLCRQQPTESAHCIY